MQRATLKIAFSGVETKNDFSSRIRDSDLDRLVTLANNQNVSRYMVYTFPYPYTKADAEWWIGIGSRHNGATTRVIEYQGIFVGGVGITPQSGWREHLGEIGYWLAEDYWGKGIAKAALRQMTDYGFINRNFRKLFASIFTISRRTVKPV